MFMSRGAPERGPNWLRCELAVAHPGRPIALMLVTFFTTSDALSTTV
jgi:hypothetical protein